LDIGNIGLGVDSVGMLAGWAKRGEAPEILITADTGSEKPETYAYLDVLRPWLAARGMPELIVVRRPPSKSGYDTLEGNCLVNGTLPSLAFYKHSCSLKWKAEAMDLFLFGRTHGPFKRPGHAPVVEALERGDLITKHIGFDCGPNDARRSSAILGKDTRYVFSYPLRAWGWDRERCMVEIVEAGLPLPIKSACFFCPASQPWEVLWLAARHPELFLRAIRLEDNARSSHHAAKQRAEGKEPFGLWGNGNGRPASTWRGWAEGEGFLVGERIAVDADWLLERAAALKPPLEANDCTLVQIGGP
jgi:hypothetical protein